MKRLYIFIFFLIISASACATSKPLPADQAFQLSAMAKDYQTILLNFKIAPHYYLYKKNFSFHVIKPEGIFLGDPLYPSNTVMLKTLLGTFQVYSSSLVIPIPIIQSDQKSLILQVNYQGCSKFGYCYPPTTKIVAINLVSNYMRAVSALKMDVAPALTATSTPEKTDHFNLNTLLNNHSLVLMMFGFFTFGVLLSLTPCVLPMIPVLSSMIVGREKISHTHSFLLSLFYVLGMSITYAIVGVLFGIVGSNIQIMFQQPWIIICFSLLFVAMALSLFGLYQIQLPEKLRSKIASTSHHQKSGTYVGACVMGVLSTLILSPCVTPPLVAALGFISHSGDALEGGVALFTMGLGMGVPLLFIGAFGPKILPKSGVWMNTIKNLMGVLLLAVAIVMLERILSAVIIMVLWAGLSLGFAIFLGALSTANTPVLIIKKMVGLLFFVYGILLMVGTYHGVTNPLAVLSVFHQQTNSTKLPFQIVRSLDEIETAIQAAEKNHQIVMLDFSADWCIACKELDTITFEDPAVKAILSRFVLLRADITKNSSQDQLLMRHYNIIAPPTILFFGDGKEIENARIIGFQSADKLLRQIESAGLNKIE